MLFHRIRSTLAVGNSTCRMFTLDQPNTDRVTRRTRSPVIHLFMFPGFIIHLCRTTRASSNLNVDRITFNMAALDKLNKQKYALSRAGSFDRDDERVKRNSLRDCGDKYLLASTSPNGDIQSS
jgi:hypothetical protein